MAAGIDQECIFNIRSCCILNSVRLSSKIYLFVLIFYSNIPSLVIDFSFESACGDLQFKHYTDLRI